MNQSKGKTNHRVIARVLRLSLALLIAWAAVSSPPFPVSPGSFQSVAKSDLHTVSTATLEGRLEVFDDVWSTISQRYYDPDFHSLGHGLTWDNQRTVFRALAAETNSAQELYAVLRRMIVSLNDSHTRVFSPAEKSDWWRPRFVTIGISIKEVDGLPTVVEVTPGSAPQRAGIVPGDIIEAINRQPALSLVQRRLADYISPNPRVRSRVFATLLEGPPAGNVELRWLRKDGRKVSGQFRRFWQERELGLRVSRKSGDLAVVEIDAFTSETSKQFALALREKLKNARAIILDLRGNGGGDAEAMTDVASSLMGPGINLGRFIDRSGTQMSLATRGKSPLIPTALPRTDAPLIVLMSERTSSAAEILIAGLIASKRARTIGTETCGCVLAIRNRHQLPDGGLLDISELDYQTASGHRLEKNGLVPGQSVILEREDLYSGRDRAMELAIKKSRMLADSKQTAGLR